MLVNGREFKINIIYTRVSAIERIAADLDSHPDFLIFSPKHPSLDDLASPATTVVDVLNTYVRNQDGVTPIIPEIPDGATRERLEKIFVATNTLLAGMDSVARKLVFLSMRSSLKIDPERAWDDRQNIVEMLNKSLAKIARGVQQQDGLVGVLDTVKAAKYTDFDIGFAQFTLTLGRFTRTLSELFNDIVLTRKAPVDEFNAA